MADSIITVGGAERLEPMANCLSKCFDDDPIITFLCNSKSREDRLAYLPDYFRVLTKAAVLNGAAMVEYDDWSSCAIWMPPGRKIDNWATNFQAGFLGCLWNIGVSGCWHMLVDFEGNVNRVKKRQLAKYNKFYYCFFLATLPEHRGRGQGSTLIQHWQQKAASENIPIWLEATTEASHRLYARMGFKDVELVMIGKGKAAADGTYLKGGEGVKLWTMIWLPPSYDKTTNDSD